MTEQPQHGDRVRVTISGTWRQQDCDGTPAIRTTRATDDDWLLAVPDDAHVEKLPPLPNETEATEPEDTCQPVEADGELQNRLRLAHQARRAKEHQLDDIRRALCDIGVIEDDDPYSHADLAMVVRQLGPGPAATEATEPTTTELAIDAERYKQDHLGACKTIADMHAAATGYRDRGPDRGVVEDVADVRARMLAAEEALTNEQRARAEDARPVPTPATEVHIHVQPDPPHVADAIRDIRRHGGPPRRS